jgi:hypothetical protein
MLIGSSAIVDITDVNAICCHDNGYSLLYYDSKRIFGPRLVSQDSATRGDSSITNRNSRILKTLSFLMSNNEVQGSKPPPEA